MDPRNSMVRTFLAGTLSNSVTSSRAPRAELLVEITPYRLLITTCLFGLGFAKALLSFRQQVVASTSVDLAIGVFGALTVYWVGYLEVHEPKIWPAFFHRDVFTGAIRSAEISPQNQPHSLELIDSTPSHNPPWLHSPLKITMHKLISTLAIGVAITVKAVYSYRGNSVVAVTMDWLIGIPLAIALYWIGLYENVRPAVMKKYFLQDLITGQIQVPELDPSEYLDHVEHIEIWGKALSPVKMTLFRILNVVVLLCFGVPKAALSYLGYSVAPTTLEATMGTFLPVIFWESPKAQGSDYFFHTDFSDSLPTSFSGIGGILFILYVALFMGYHAWITFSFAATVVVLSEQNNGADKAARIVLIIWWSASLIGYSRLGRLNWDSIEILMPNAFGLFGWYGINFLVIWLMALLKEQGGYTAAIKGNDTDVGDASDSGWHWTIGVGGGDVIEGWGFSSVNSLAGNF